MLQLLEEQILFANPRLECVALRPLLLAHVDERRDAEILGPVLVLDAARIGLRQHRLDGVAVAPERAEEILAAENRLPEPQARIVLAAEVVEDRPGLAFDFRDREPADRCKSRVGVDNPLLALVQARDHDRDRDMIEDALVFVALGDLGDLRRCRAVRRQASEPGIPPAARGWCSSTLPRIPHTQDRPTGVSVPQSRTLHKRRGSYAAAHQGSGSGVRPAPSSTT